VSVAVLRFPGSLDHESAARAIRTAGGTAAEVWHDEPGLPGGARAVVIPGGFSWGDHLRPGAIASRSRVMEDVRRHAERGGMVLGICNGFQVLCEAGLLPGALRPNATLSFVCRQTTLEVTDPDAPWTRALGAGARLSIPIKNNSAPGSATRQPRVWPCATWARTRWARWTPSPACWTRAAPCWG